MDKRYMNTGVSFNGDFYNYATGNWKTFHEQPDDEPRWSSFDVLDRQVTCQLKEIIGSLDETKPFQKKMKDYFRILTDYGRRNMEKSEPMQKYIKKIRDSRTKDELLRYVVEELDSEFFISIALSPDEKDPDWYKVHIWQSLTMDNPEYYTTTDKATRQYKDRYMENCHQILIECGYSPVRAAAMIGTFFRYEDILAKDCYTFEELEEPEKNYNCITVDELSVLCDWDMRKFLSYYHYDDRTTDVIVCQKEALICAFRLYREMTLEEMKDCAEFSFVMDNCMCLQEEIGEIAFLYTQFVTGQKKRTEKWRREINAMASTFSEELSRMYTERYCDKEIKEYMQTLIRNIMDAFAVKIENQTWMSGKTKQLALEKLRAMKYDKICYPDKYKDYSDMPVNPELSYLDNEIEISHYMRDRAINEYYCQKVDKDEWDLPTYTVNAYYSQATNEIVFPCGILQPPFFSKDWSDADNYGAIGVIIAHEITHGFDAAGRLFTKDGVLEDWWTDEDAGKFEALTENTVERFDHLWALPFLNANGRLTLNENIADNGGVSTAYAAVENVMNDKVDEMTDGFTWQQRFFITYAQLWAGVETEEVIRNSVLNGVHSILKLRVNGTLPMFSKWYEAFNIDNTSPLYVSENKRGLIWS